MVDETNSTLLRTIRNSAHPMDRMARDYDPLLELIGDAKLVLLGEASHGTHEFYDARAQITQRLIQEKGFSAVAVEADWPDAYRVNRYIRAMGVDRHSRDALKDFKRFPVWMWRNSDVLDFVDWLRRYNDKRRGRVIAIPVSTTSARILKPTAMRQVSIFPPRAKRKR